MNKQDWINYMSERTILPIDILEKEYADNYNERKINIYNSVTGKSLYPYATEFLNNLYQNQIIVENGVIFNNHDVFTSLVVKTLITLKKLRSKYKNLMFEAKKVGDIINTSIHNVAQSNMKLCSNTYYGVSAQSSGKVYNHHVAASTTARGRGTISLNGLTLEATLGTYRPYNLTAHLDFIHRVSHKDIPKDILDLCPEHSDEDILKNVLQKYYEDYYGIDILRKKLATLTPDEKKKVYYASNFGHCINIPRVKELIRLILEQQNIAINHKGDQIDKYAEVVYVNPEKPPKEIASYMAEIKEIFKYLLVGFYWYEGDIDEYGIEQVTNQDKFRTIERETIVLTDTDSVIETLEPSIRKIEAMFPDIKDLISNLGEDFRSYIIGSIVIEASSLLIDEGIKRYTNQSLITERYRDNVKYKQEFFFKTLQTTMGAKNYIGVTVIQEGNYLPHEDIDVKGLSLKKTNFNKKLSEKAYHIATEMIAKQKLPNPKAIFDEISEFRSSMVDVFRKKDNLDIFTVGKLKTNYNDTPKGDYRFKSVDLYNKLFSEHIPLPGSFLVCKLDLENREEDIQENYPEIYNKLLEIVEERTIYGTVTSIENRATTYFGDSIPDVVSDILEEIRKETESSKLKELISNIKKMYKNMKLTTDELNWIDKLSFKQVKFKDINRIAIPIDSETVPDFIPAYSDINDINVFDNLIAVLIKGLGFEVIRNGRGQQIVHNIVSYY